MLEITIKITQEPGDSYTPIETAVIEALQGAATIGTRTTEATVKPAEAPAAAAEAVAAEAPAAPAPKKAPARAPKAAAAPKPSTGPAVLEEDPAPVAEEEPEADTEDDEDLLGGGEERVYTVQEAVTRASAVVKEKDGRARIKVALARASEAGAATYGKVGDMAEDAAALSAFMVALEA